MRLGSGVMGGPGAVQPLPAPRRLATWLIRIYQSSSRFRPPTCRFLPTCSEYAAQAIVRYGVWHGVALAFRRILRCNPFSSGGFDPVP